MELQEEEEDNNTQEEQKTPEERECMKDVEKKKVSEAIDKRKCNVDNAIMQDMGESIREINVET